MYTYRPPHARACARALEEGGGGQGGGGSCPAHKTIKFFALAYRCSAPCLYLQQCRATDLQSQQ